jgi:hypothetical protein
MNKLEAGLTIERWTLLWRDSSKPYHWTCKCGCTKGTIKSIRDSSLKSGKSQSCGCLKLELLEDRKTHGMSGTPTYISWQGMWRRVRHHPDYLRKGIKVCPRWESFNLFLEDMDERPEGKSIERLNNDGDYEPGNCIWDTPTAQNRNKKGCMFITSERLKTTKALAEWAEILCQRTNTTIWKPKRLKSILKDASIDDLLTMLKITEIEHCATHDEYELVAA